MKSTTVRAWQGANSRQSLTSELQATLLENPIRELTDADLKAVQGGSSAEGILDNLNLKSGGLLGNSRQGYSNTSSQNEGNRLLETSYSLPSPQLVN